MKGMISSLEECRKLDTKVYCYEVVQRGFLLKEMKFANLTHPLSDSFKKSLIMFKYLRKKTLFRQSLNVFDDDIIHFVTKLLNDFWRCNSNLSETLV
jgi:hypothetical protein